jgi:hypothetical protein
VDDGPILDTPGKRLTYFIEVRYGGNKSEFARIASVLPSSVTGWVMDKKQPGLDAISGFLVAGLNVIWYANGEGGISNMDYHPGSESAQARALRREKVAEAMSMVAELRSELVDLAGLL